MDENNFDLYSEKIIKIINDDKYIKVRGLTELMKIQVFSGNNHNVMKFKIIKYFNASFESNIEGLTYNKDIIVNDEVQTYYFDGKDFLDTCDKQFEDKKDLINPLEMKGLDLIKIGEGSIGGELFGDKYPAKFEKYKYDIYDNLKNIYKLWSSVKVYTKDNIDKIRIHLSGYGNGSNLNDVTFNITKKQFIEIYGESEINELEVDKKGFYRCLTIESYDAFAEALVFEPNGKFVSVIRDIFYTEDELGFDVSEREISSSDGSIKGYFLLYKGVHDYEGKQLSKEDLKKFNKSTQQRSGKYEGIDLYRSKDFDLKTELNYDF